MTSEGFTFKKINKRITLIIVLMVGGFFFSQIYIMSHVGTKSSEVERIRQEKDEIRRDNEILTANIASQKSIKKIRPLITKLGLEEKRVVELKTKAKNDLAYGTR